MEITKIKLTNIRCFENLEVDLKNTEGAKKWMVILGDNGVGKSTILRSIALGLCEESGASALLAEISDMIRNGAEEGKIRIDVLPYKNYKGKAYVETTITRSEYDEYKLKQVTVPKDPNDFKWEKLFLCAYGSSRGIIGTSDISEYAVTDSVYSLFVYKSDLQNPELCLRRAQSEIPIDSILRKLENVLMLEKNSIELIRTGITVKGPWGEAMPFRNLGDGYKSILTWLLDLYGWKLLFEEHMKDEHIEGIVIMDEIEQHLHPRWQKQIINLLSIEFPKVQFIITTHSPLCVTGTTDLKDEDCSIIALHQFTNSVKISTTTPPRGKRVDQILTSYLFEIYTASDNKIKQDIERYSKLNSKQRTTEEEEEMQKLINTLNDSLGTAETELEKKVGKVLNKTLDDLFTGESTDADKKNAPEKFELLRQLNDLLK